MNMRESNWSYAWKWADRVLEEGKRMEALPNASLWYPIIAVAVILIVVPVSVLGMVCHVYNGGPQ